MVTPGRKARRSSLVGHFVRFSPFRQTLTPFAHTDIVKAFKASLPHIPWMDDESADTAAQKANNIRVKVGYPISPDTRNPRSISNWYARVDVRDSTFFENMVSARYVSSLSVIPSALIVVIHLKGERRIPEVAEAWEAARSGGVGDVPVDGERILQPAC